MRDIEKGFKTMNDFEKCLAELDKYGAHYFVRHNDEKETIEVVCYEPYIVYDFKANTAEILSYVYHWIDTYSKTGSFISHEAYEGVYSRELNTSI